MSPAENQAEIEQIIELDLDELMKELEHSLEQILKGLDTDEEKVEAKKNDYFKDFSFDMSNKQILSFDTKSTWVTKVVTNIHVDVVDPKNGKKRKEISSITTIQ